MKTVVFFCLLLASCWIGGQEGSEKAYRFTDVRIYKETPAWELAKAVESQNVNKIKKIAEENPELLEFRDPDYETPLVVWATCVERYKSLKALLESGASPDAISGYTGGTALYKAAGYSSIDRIAKKSADYVSLLLEYGADPNINYTGRSQEMLRKSSRAAEGVELSDITETGTSPLMNSISCGLEKTKALVEAGADVNHKTPSGETAASLALSHGAWNSTVEERRYAHYLIAEMKADITEPSYRRESSPLDDPNEKFFPVELLRYWVCNLDSEDYRLKMEIVEEFARQGVDYWATEIPSDALEDIKKRYPDTWEEYINKY